MEFKCKKVNNCFEDAETYEYKTNYINEDLIPFFQSLGSCIVNYKFKKPIFFLEMNDKTRVKGIISDSSFKVSYLNGSNQAKQRFESQLREY